MAAATSRALSYTGGQATFVDDATLCYQAGNTVKLSNVETGAEAFLGGQGFGIAAVAACAQPGLVVYAEKGVAPTVNVFSFPALKPLATLEGVAQLDVDAVAVSRDGSTIVVAAGGPDFTVTAYTGGPDWRAATAICSAPAKDGCMAVSINPADPTEICSISAAGQVTLRRILPGAEGHTLESWCPLPEALAGEEAVSHSWSANHRLVIGFASGAAVSLDLEGLDVATVAPVATLCPAQEPPLAATAVSSTATRVLVGFADGTLSWLDDTGAAAPVTKEVTTGAVVSISLGSGGKLWVGSESGSVSAVTLRDAVAEADQGDAEVDIEVAFNHNSEPLLALGHVNWQGEACLVSCSPAGTVSTWGADLLGSLATGSEATCMSVCSTTGLVAVGSAAGVIRLIDVSNPAEPKTVNRSRAHDGAVTHVEFDASGAYLASAGQDGKLFFTDAAGRKSFAALGYITTPAAVTSLVWRDGSAEDGVDSEGLRLIACTASGELLQLTPPAADFASAADLKMTAQDVDLRAWRVREPLVRMAVSPTATGFLYGFTAKGPGAKYTRRFDMRTTDLTPAGEKPKLLKVNPLSDTGHVKAGTSLAFAADGAVLVTGGRDGAIVVRKMDSSGDGAVVANLRRHDGAGFEAEGVSCLAMGENDLLYSGGFDGALFELSVKGAAAPSVVNARSEFLSSAGAVDEADAAPEEEQEDVIALSKAAARAAVAAAAAEGGDTTALRSSVKTLKERFQQCLKNNDEVPELEKMERDEFIIDHATVSAKKAEADAEAEALRAKVRSENVVRDMIAGNIKVDCYDVMQVQKAVISAFDSGVEVPNFPLKKQSDAELEELEVVKAARAAEKAEQDWILQNEPSESNVIVEEGDDALAKGEGETEGEDDDDEGEEGEGEEAEGAEEEALEALLYKPEELNTSRRKRVMVQLLDAKIRILRQKFNGVFEDHMDKKDNSISEIMGKRARCQEIVDELGTLGEGLEVPEPVAFTDAEQPEKVLTVEDGEIEAAKWISPEQQKILDEEAAEAARREAEKGNSPFDRALVEMMGGSLNANENQMRLDEVVEKPEWMLETPEDDLSDEQKAEIEAFDTAAADRAEQVAKEVNVLKTVMRKTVGEIAEQREKFDGIMDALYKIWVASSQEIFQVELWRVRLSNSILTGEELVEREAELRKALKEKSADKSVAAQAAKAFRRSVDATQADLDKLLAEDKTKEKAFKKEFNDSAEIMDTLLALWKQRFRSGKAPKVVEPAVDPDADPWQALEERKALRAAAAEVMGEPLSFELDVDPSFPVPEPVWTRLVAARDKKMEFEGVIAKQRAVLDAEMAVLDTLSKAEAHAKATLDTLQNDLQTTLTEMSRNVTDLEVQVKLKQGQVEVDQAAVVTDYGDSLLLPTSMIEDLNQQIKASGAQKVGILVSHFRPSAHDHGHLRRRLHRHHVLGFGPGVPDTRMLSLLRVGGDQGGRQAHCRAALGAGPSGAGGARPHRDHTRLPAHARHQRAAEHHQVWLRQHGCRGERGPRVAGGGAQDGARQQARPA